MKTFSPRIRGFSLIELMVVIFIIAIIAAFVVPAASTVLRGSQLTQGSQILYDQISLARQYALSKNHPVEVRLIRYADPETPGEASASGGPGTPSQGNFRAVQVFETLDAIDPSTNDFVRVPLDKPAILPQSIIMTNSELSSLIVAAVGPAARMPAVPSYGTPSSKDPQLPRNVGTQYDFASFRFMPDGSTNLPPTGSWFVTLLNINDVVAGTTPPNFYCLQIDPVTGEMKQYRPGLAPQ